MSECELIKKFRSGNVRLDVEIKQLYSATNPLAVVCGDLICAKPEGFRTRTIDSLLVVRNKLRCSQGPDD